MVDKDRKPHIPADGAPSFRIRPEDLAEFLRIKAQDPHDPRLWDMLIPLFGYEDEQPKPDAPSAGEPQA